MTSTSLDKISAGIAKGQAVSKNTKTRSVPTIPPLSDLLGLRGDLHSLKTIRNVANKAHANVEQIRVAVADSIASQEVKIRAKYENYGKAQGDKGRWIDNDDAKAERRKVIERELSQTSKQLRAINEEPLRANMITVNEARAKIKLLERAWDNPVKILMRTTVYSDRRATLTANLQHCGPGELIGYAEQALHKNDRDLGAAVLSRLEKMPPKSRDAVTQVLAESNISKDDFAGALVHPLWLEAQAHIGMAKLHADSAEQAILEASGKPARPIAFALRKQQLLDQLGIETLEEAFKTAEPEVIAPAQKPIFEDQRKKDPRAYDPQAYLAAMDVFTKAYGAGDFAEAKRIAKEHKFDWVEFSDEESSNDA